MTMRHSVWVVAITTLMLGVGIGPAHAAQVPVKCPDGFTVWVEVGAGGAGFYAQAQAACAGHQGTSQQDGGDPGGSEPASSQPEGYWLNEGPACDNGGICATPIRCPDGKPMQQFVFINANGERGETRTVCPGDPDIPEVTATPPTPGEIFRAFKEVAPTKSVLSIQPPGGKTLVNFPTIFSTEAEPFSTPSIPLVKGFSVVFHISPAAYVWEHGDGSDAVTTDWPGEAWSQGADVEDLLTHTYQTLDPVKASVTVRWGAKVSLNGGPPQPVDGTVNAPSSEVDLRILEATPELVE